MLRGVKNIRDLGRVIEYKNEEQLDVWDVDECNEYKGTDSTIFAPFGRPEDHLWAFEPAACRAMKIFYTGQKTKYHGVPTLLLTSVMGDASQDPELQCFCRSDEHCPAAGTIDLYPCIGELVQNILDSFYGFTFAGVPIIGSSPHFYGADPKLLNKVNGLKPNASQHEVYIHFEIVSMQLIWTFFFSPKLIDASAVCPNCS